MSDAAIRKRDLTANKLKESIRQLRRLLDSKCKSKRILEQKYKTIELEKNELFDCAFKVIGADEETERYLQPKLDAAEDIINEALEVIDMLYVNDTEENKKNEVAVLLKEVRHNEEILLHYIEEV